MTPLDASTSLPQRVDLRPGRTAATGTAFADAVDAFRAPARGKAEPSGTASTGSTPASGDDASRDAGPEPNDGSTASTQSGDGSQPEASASSPIKLHGASSVLLRARLSAVAVADAPASQASAKSRTGSGQADATDKWESPDPGSADGAEAKTSASQPSAGETTDPVIGSLAALLGASVATPQTAAPITAPPAEQGNAASGVAYPKRLVPGDVVGSTRNGVAAVASDAVVTSGADLAPQAVASPRQAVPAKAPVGVNGSGSSRSAPATSGTGAQAAGAASAITTTPDDAASGASDQTASALVAGGKVVARTDGEVPSNPAPAPTQQVLAALRSLGLDDAGETGSTSSAPASNPLATPGEIPTTPPSALRSVTIQLQPAHLGDVALTVQRQGGVLAVTVTVGNSRALQTLEKDRELLDKAVAAAGGSRDTLALTLAAGAGDAAATSAPPPASSGTPAGAPGDMSQGREAGRDRRSEPATMQSGIEDDQRSTDGAAPVRVDRGLYL